MNQKSTEFWIGLVAVIAGIIVIWVGYKATPNDSAVTSCIGLVLVVGGVLFAYQAYRRR